MHRVFSELGRRGFLRRCWQTAGAFLLPGTRRAVAVPEFHLHPHYREQIPLDAVITNIASGGDDFASEPYHDSVAATLRGWGRGLKESPKTFTSVVLDSAFAGVRMQPVERRLLRESAGGLVIERLVFSREASLQSEQFLREMRSYFETFSSILTAEFQITHIELQDRMVHTKVRYELVGSGDGFFREQRVGAWLLDWTRDGHAVTWRMEDEVRCRTSAPFFSDITRAAFSKTTSYPAQLLHGADYWRTILDGASGIDIYGHNGVSVGDIDGDGFDDIYICQPAGLPNRLYRNRGDGTFEDVTEWSGVGLLDNTACALFADFDNDGRQDLVVVRASGPLLFLNEGNGKFRQKQNAFQFANVPQGTFTGASAADYNRDGLLDIYFCLYTYYQGTDQYKYPTPYYAAENGPPNFLMRNNGDGTFQDVTSQCGLDKNNTRYSFCCGWSDYDLDGWPDLYVVNDFGLKNLYRNHGDGTFTDVAGGSGVEDVGAGMSVSWLDCNNDGKQDLYVANMWTAAGERLSGDPTFQVNAASGVRDFYRKHAMGNSLFRNGGSSFTDRTSDSKTGIGRWAWSSDAWDFDHDGFADIYIANGMISGPIEEDLNSFFWREVVAKSPNTFKSDADYEQGWNAVNELVRSDYSWSGFERNILYENHGDGTFSDISGAVGLDFLEDSRAFALADFDGDGRQDVILKNRNAPQIRLMKNIASGLPAAISFRLRGTRSNRDAIGAAVTIETSAGTQTKLLQAGSGFLSQHSKELFFGLGGATGNVSASIRWPSGTVQKITGLTPNHRITVSEGSEALHREPFRPFAKPGSDATTPEASDELPVVSGTWMMVPVLAPQFHSAIGKAKLLSFQTASRATDKGGWPADAPELVEINIDDPANQDICAVYNLLFRSLFDRHRDLPVPTSFLIDEAGKIIKVYQGPVSAEIVKSDTRSKPSTDAGRLAKGLPFAGIADSYQFGRNYLSLGSTFFQRGYADYAEPFFRAAVEQDPGSAEALYGLGSVYLKQGNIQLAQDSFQRTVQLTASYPETTPNAWNNLGLIATRGGNTNQAVSYFEQAVKVDPNHFIALENLGNAYKQQRRFREARIKLEQALAIKPKDAEANYSLGMVLAQMDDTDAAKVYLDKALEARPIYPEALNNLGILYLRTRRRDEAVATFERCMRLAPAFSQSYLNLARVYVIEGTPEKARSVLNALLSQHPDDKAAKQALSQLP